jgi:hypothetical protein
MVEWYKANRDVLEADVVHLRRADGRRLDYVLHVLPEKGVAMAVIYNPTKRDLEEEIDLPLESHGLKGKVRQTGPKGGQLHLKPPQRVRVRVPASSWTWIKFSRG